MQTSSQWSVLIGLFYFHFNKMSPPLLFSAPHLLFCPLRFSQDVLAVDTPASSRLPTNGAVNSVICVSARPDEGQACLNGAPLCTRRCSRTRAGTGSWKRRRWGRWKKAHESRREQREKLRLLECCVRSSGSRDETHFWSAAGADATKTVIQSYSEYLISTSVQKRF